MTQGPPCPNCGTLLQWFPDQQQWGCGQCRVMFPPQVMVTPQAYATVQPRAKRVSKGKQVRSRKPLFFALAAVILAGGAIAGTILVIHHGKHRIASYPSLDAAVRSTFDALSAGDPEPILAHAGAGLAAKITSCDGASEQEAKAIAAMREDLAAQIVRDRGATFHITKIEESGAPTVKEKGRPYSRGCTLETAIVTHTIHVALELERGSKKTITDAMFEVVEIEGEFYTVSVPKLGGCEGAATTVATVASGEAKAPEISSKLELTFATACSDDKWPAKVIECTAHALAIKDVRSCAKDLDANQLTGLTRAIQAAAEKSPAASQLLAMAPPPTEVKGADPNATLGTPAQAGVADFWLTPRSDGAYVLESPLVTAVFPSRPTAKVAKSSKPNADGKLFDIYTFAVEPTPNKVLYQLEIIAMGRNMRDEGGFENLEVELAKVGKVEKAQRTEDQQAITRFTVAGGALILDGRIDLARGLIINSTASTDAATKDTGTAFLASVHVRQPTDALQNPDTLVGVRQRKGTKGKLVLHDKDDTFTLEMPFNAKVERTVETAQHAVVVTATSAKKRAQAVILISEYAAWDALAIGPTKLVELQKANKKAHLVWNAFQHRMFRVTCTDTPCDPIVKSLHFTDPVK